jgi:hypothetical protein
MPHKKINRQLIFDVISPSIWLLQFSGEETLDLSIPSMPIVVTILIMVLRPETQRLAGRIKLGG